MLTSLKTCRPLQALLIALFFFAAAVGLRCSFLSSVGTSVPYVTFFPAVMFAALVGGIWAGLLVTILSALFACYYLMEPVGTIVLRHAGDWLGLVTFLLSCAMASWLSEFLRLARKRADEAEARAELAAEREKAAAAIGQSEARFRFYVENSPIAVLVADRAGNYVDFNRAATELLGYPAETLSCMHILEVHPIEEHQTVLREFAGLFETGALAAETRMLRNDGRALWVSLHAACLDSDHVIAYCQDITGKREDLEAMRERLVLQEQLAMITSVVPGIIHSFRLRPDGSCCLPYAGPGLQRIYGLHPAQVALDAAPVLELIHPDDREEFNRARAESARTLSPWRQEFRVSHPEEGDIWVELHSTPSREPDGSVLWQGFVHDITRRRSAQEMVREATRRLELATESGGLGVWEWKLNGPLLWNHRMFELYGVDPESFDGSIDTWNRALHPDDLGRVLAEREAALRGEQKFRSEFRVLRPGGEVKTLKADAVVVRDQNGAPVRMVGLNRDLTEQRKLESQLQQAQKMEALGRLAGGVAHDFNNNLSVILGYAELARMVEINSAKFHDYLDEIVKAAEHSRDVTRQLLAFSRNEIITPRMVDLNRLLEGSDKAMWRMIGEDIRLVLVPGQGIWPVLIDPAQFNQIVINLAVNARDAMPDGGTLVIETRNLPSLELRQVGSPEAAPGDYVLMTVTDTGVGMERELQARIFEPFFTTKGIAKGTGLGLATVYGIMIQNGGFIMVRSEPGEGACFSLFFPRLKGEQAVEEGEVKAQPELPGDGCVLLVEDELSVRLMAHLMLERFGYRVLVAENPLDALEKCRGSEREIDCLLTDVVMPGMNGVELSQKVRELRPGIAIVYMSGYSADMIAHHGVLEPGVIFLQKPFDIGSMNEKLQQAIRSSRSSAADPGP